MQSCSGSSTRPGRLVRRVSALTGITVALLASSAFAQRPLGIDVSYWQGASGMSQATWDSVAAAGRSFAMVRITHYSIPGTETDAHGDPDPACGNNVARARAAGLLVGIYHFARPAIRDPQTEANAFVNYATTYFGSNFVSSGYLRPMLDLENGSSTLHVGANTLTDWCIQWMDAVEAQTGVEPLIYCGGNYASQLDSRIASRTLWFANYRCTADPQTAGPTASISPWSNWTFWQYCSSLAVGNVSPVDTDVFNGTMAQLQTYVIGGGNIPPVISGVQATNVTNNAATITWTTTSGSTSQVQYGLTNSYGTSSSLDSTAVTSHSVTITGLSANTLYHYRAISTNAYGTTNSTDYTFTTAGPPTITPPTPINIGADTATIIWTTNVPANSQVRYGLTAAYGNQSPLDSTLVTSHSVVLTGLMPSTLYHYQVLSANAYGTAQSTDLTFSTTGAPVISAVASNGVTSSSATITWTTDVPADTQVEYGTTTGYGTSSVLNGSMVTAHSVTLSGLTGTTLYHYRVRSANAGGTRYSGDYTFTTTSFTGEVIVDNTDPGFAYLSGSGWTIATTSSHYGSNYFWANGVSSTAESAATHKAQWTPSLPVAGTWDVYIWYCAGSNRSTQTYWKIVGATSTQNLRVNEQINGSAWTLIASDVAFYAGTAGNVQLWNNVGSTTKIIQGDAVRFVFKNGDTVPPSVPANVASTAITTTSIRLAWDTSTDNFGLSGYKVYRDGGAGADTATNSYLDGGLIANTTYSYQVSAYDAAPNESAKSAALVLTTLSVPPVAGSVTAGSTTPCVGASVTWTAVGGFGPGKIAYYRYAWDRSSTHTFTGAEPQWSAGTMDTSPTAAGAWYLHVAGYNSANVLNGTYNYTVTANAATAITQQPQSQAVDTGASALLTTVATGTGTITYQWQKDGAAIADGGHYAGTTTATLSVTNAITDDAGSYTCVVTGGCGDVTSDAATLTVNAPPRSPADFDGDGDVDLEDFSHLRVCFNGPNRPPSGADCANADFDHDNDVDLDDFSIFRGCFNGPNRPSPCQ